MNGRRLCRVPAQKFEQGGHQGAKQLQQELKRFQAGLRTGGKSGLARHWDRCQTPKPRGRAAASVG